jgi:hypothetical protein
MTGRSDSDPESRQRAVTVFAAGAFDERRCTAVLLALVYSAFTPAFAAAATTGTLGTFDVFCSLSRPIVEPGGSVKASVVAGSGGGVIDYRWTAADGTLVVPSAVLSRRSSASEVEWKAGNVSPGVHVIALHARRLGGSTASCSLKVVVASPERGSAKPSVADLRRALLPAGDVESAGFGLYSYVILPSDCATSTPGDVFDRCTLFVRTSLSGIVAQNDFARGSDFSASRLNLTYLLVKRTIPPKLKAGLDQNVDLQVRWVLANYDYARCQKLLWLLGRSTSGDGPSVVSLKDPIFLSADTASGGSHSQPPAYLYQTYSDVSLDTMQLVMTRFQKQSLQADFSQPSSLDAFSRDLRKFVAYAGLSSRAANSDVKMFEVQHRP